MHSCRFCGQDKRMAKSHVIPNFVFRHMHPPNGHSRVLTTVVGRYGRTASTGPYDEDLLCQDCEQRFASLDTYGKRFLVDGVYKSFILDRPGSKELWIWDFDCSLLRRFILFVLWRCAASTRPEFIKLQLPSLLPMIREQVSSDLDYHQGLFPLIFRKFDGPVALLRADNSEFDIDPRDLHFNPTISTFAGQSSVKIYMLDWTVWVGLSDWRRHPLLSRYIMRSNAALIVTLADYRRSRELVLAHRMCHDDPPNSQLP